MIKNDEISIVFCGEAGQGIETVTGLASKIYKRCGYNVCLTKEYMSRIRGGSNSSEIRLSSHRVNSYTEKIDILFALSKGAIPHLIDRISEDTIIFIDSVNIPEGIDLSNKTIIETNITETAKSCGGKLYENTVAAGMIFGITNICQNIPEEVFRQLLEDKSEEIVQNNISAMKKGYEAGEQFAKEKDIQINISKSETVKNELFLSGDEASVMGFVAGGCDFISSYPMSPSTGVLIGISHAARTIPIVTEQAEDEISAINMGIGAWYAGARAMVTTSGGGFALMTEGVSLAGIIESPMVIHLAQRPGPATGLPTRTEQGDLDLALYSGHGDFPRVIYAPGDLTECYYLAKKAFEIADACQIPAFVLTDQYILDSNYNVPIFDLQNETIKKHITESSEDYKRYAFTENGLSPRSVPSYGNGLVCVDSDEHDEEGHLTENLKTRVKMVDKRNKKMQLILQDSVAPELLGNPDYKALLIGWGSTKNSIIEALRISGREDLALLHFKQVYPLPPQTQSYLDKAEKLVAIENNPNAQLAKLLKTELCRKVDDTILRYDGMPFAAEILAENLKNI